MARWFSLIAFCIAAHAAPASGQLTCHLDIAPLEELHDKTVDLKEVYAKRAAKILDPLGLKTVGPQDAARLLIEIRYAFDYSSGGAPGALQRYQSDRFSGDASASLARSPSYLIIERWYFWDRKTNTLVAYVGKATTPTSTTFFQPASKLGPDPKDEATISKSLVKILIEEMKFDPVDGVTISLTPEDRIAVEFKKPKYFEQFVPSRAPSKNGSILTEQTFDRPETQWSTPRYFELDNYKRAVEHGWDIAHPSTKGVPKLSAHWSKKNGSRTYTNGEYQFTLTLELSAGFPNTASFPEKISATSPGTVPASGPQGVVLKSIEEQLERRTTFERLFEKLAAKRK